MATAVNRLHDIQGGFVVVADGEVLAELALPIAGLMSDLPYEDVREALYPLRKAAKRIGVTLAEPFLTGGILVAACDSAPQDNGFRRCRRRQHDTGGMTGWVEMFEGFHSSPDHDAGGGDQPATWRQRAAGAAAARPSADPCDVASHRAATGATYTVVCADLRGYGDSSKPPTTPDHEPYSKRAMARDHGGGHARARLRSLRGRRP